MKKLFKIMIAVLMLSGISQLKAADWRNWSNYSKITGIVRQGSNIWIAGHGGVTKIDTLTFQKTNYIKTAGQLPSLMVEDIASDAATSTIWIGTYDNGLVQVHNGQWTTYAYPTGVTFYHFTIDHSSIVWCATSNGLYKFVNGTFTQSRDLNTFNIWDVKAFPNGKLLLASFRPFIYDPALDTAVVVNTSIATYGMSFIEIENDSSFFFTADPQAISHMIDTTEYIIEDSLILNGNSDQFAQMQLIDNKLTVLTANNKLYQYNGSTWSLHPNNSDAQSIIATYLYHDANGSNWLGGIHDGGEVKQLNKSTDLSLKKAALVSNIVSAIQVKSSTELWVLAGNEIGAYNKVSHQFTQVYQLAISQYYNLFNVGDMTIWNGTPVALTDSGLFEFARGAWFPFNYPGLINVNYMLCIAADSSGNLYIGTLNGIYVVSIGGAVTAYTPTNTPVMGSNGVIRKAYFDASRNTMWFSTTQGILRFSNGVFSIIDNNNNPQLTNYTYISAIAQDPSGNMWFGTAYGGLVKYDGTSFTTDSVGASTGNQTVQAIVFDGSTMYAGDNVYGFWVRDNGVWTNYNTANSDMTNNNVTGLHIDDDHNVWLTGLDNGTLNTFGIDIYNKSQVVLAVNEIEKQNASTIYPNPAENILTISSESIKDGDEVILTDIAGRDQGTFVVSSHKIDISRLSSGVYLLNTADRRMATAKVIKE